MEYRFIVISDKNDLNKGMYDYAYSEVRELDYALFDDYFYFKKIVQFLFKINKLVPVNSFIEKTFIDLWLKKRINRYSRFYNTNDKICFLMFADCIKYEKYSFSKIIREKFPNSKIVYFFQDLVKRDKEKQEFLGNKNNLPDLIYSFDYGDAEKYNLKFHNIPYSNISAFFENSEIKYDISFVGQTKDRLNEIIEVYKILKKQGLKCGFFIVGVSEDQQILKDEINYCKFIPYKEYLKILTESKCVLEIMQKGGTGNTIRVSEAIVFDKLLISNNKMLLQNSFYDSKYMKVYENLEELNVVRKFIELNQDVYYENKEKVYPSTFFKQIEKDLKELEAKEIDNKK